MAKSPPEKLAAALRANLRRRKGLTEAGPVKADKAGAGNPASSAVQSPSQPPAGPVENLPETEA